MESLDSGSGSEAGRSSGLSNWSADGRAGWSSSTSGSAFLFGRKDKDRDRRGRAMWRKLRSKVSIGGGRSGVSKRDRAKKSKHHEAYWETPCGHRRGQGGHRGERRDSGRRGARSQRLSSGRRIRRGEADAEGRSGSGSWIGSRRSDFDAKILGRSGCRSSSRSSSLNDWSADERASRLVGNRQ